MFTLQSHDSTACQKSSIDNCSYFSSRLINNAKHQILSLKDRICYWYWSSVYSSCKTRCKNFKFDLDHLASRNRPQKKVQLTQSPAVVCSNCSSTKDFVRPHAAAGCVIKSWQAQMTARLLQPVVYGRTMAGSKLLCKNTCTMPSTFKHTCETVNVAAEQHIDCLCCLRLPKFEHACTFRLLAMSNAFRVHKNWHILDKNSSMADFDGHLGWKILDQWWTLGLC